MGKWSPCLIPLVGKIIPHVGVSMGRAGQVCAQPANRPVRDWVADSQPTTILLRGSVCRRVASISGEAETRRKT